jgi:hypothetical protein
MAPQAVFRDVEVAVHLGRHSPASGVAGVKTIGERMQPCCDRQTGGSSFRERHRDDSTFLEYRPKVSQWLWFPRTFWSGPINYRKP